MNLEISNFHAFKSAELQRLVETEHHFVGVNKMVPAGGSESCVEINTGIRKLEARIVESDVKLLKA
jgi:hypothetical protein